MTSFVSPEGRLVQGDCFEPQTKNMAGQPLVDKKGQPTIRYFIAVAFPKNTPEINAFLEAQRAVARQAFPQLHNPQGQCSHPRFSFKVMDGDGIDDNGKQNNTKEGFAGHWVIKFSSSFPPSCYEKGKYDPMQRLTKGQLKRGDYVRVAGNMEGNNDATKPGLYMNHNMIELSRIGTEIVSGPSAADVFGGGQPQPQYQQQPQFTPPQQTAAPQFTPQQQPLQPNMAFVNNAGQAPQFNPPPPVVPIYIMTPLAKGYTREQWIASGVTDEQLLTNGYMVKQ